MNGFVVDSVKYSCKVSRSLEQLFQSQQNKPFPSQQLPLQQAPQMQPFPRDSQSSHLFQSPRELDFSFSSYERTPSNTSRVLQLTTSQPEQQSSPLLYSMSNYHPESQKFF